MKFPLVRDLVSEGFPVGLTCGVLGFSRQAFDKWERSPISQRDWDDAHLANELFDLHRAFQEAEELVKGRQWHNDHDLIFTSTIGTPLDPEQFGKTVPKIAIEAGLGHWSIHELRHSCASIMIAMDVPLEVIAEQLGHASIRVTKDVYGHLHATFTSPCRSGHAGRSLRCECPYGSRQN